MTDDRRLRETLDDPAAFEAALSGFVAGPLADEGAARILGEARRRAAVPRTTRERLLSWWERLAASPRLIPALALSLLLANLGLDALTFRGPIRTRPETTPAETATFTGSELGLDSSWLDDRTRLTLATKQLGTKGFHRPGAPFDTIND